MWWFEKLRITDLFPSTRDSVIVHTAVTPEDQRSDKIQELQESRITSPATHGGSGGGHVSPYHHIIDKNLAPGGTQAEGKFVARGRSFFNESLMQPHGSELVSDECKSLLNDFSLFMYW